MVVGDLQAGDPGFESACLPPRSEALSARRERPPSCPYQGLPYSFMKAVSRRSGRISTYSIDVPREQLLTVKQVAKELGVANTRVMTLVRRGDLAATRPGGPATWRIQRAQLDAYTERTRAEGVARQQRRQAKLVKSLSDAWARVSDEGKRQLERDMPQDLYRPLTHVMDPKRQQRPADMAALVHAYRRRTDFGIEELALDMPDDLFWAVARLALGRE